MAPDKLENGTQYCFNMSDCRLFISKFSQFAFYLSLSHSVISRVYPNLSASVAASHLTSGLSPGFCSRGGQKTEGGGANFWNTVLDVCSNRGAKREMGGHRFKIRSRAPLATAMVSVVLNVRFTTNGMCVMNNTDVARTSRNKISTSWDLYCCLGPQFEGLCTCCSACPITTKWYFDQDVKMVPGTTFTKRTCNRCGLLKKLGMLLEPLGWRCIENVVFICPIRENDQRWSCTRI